MTKRYQKLFESFKIGNLTIKNRFVMAPMGFYNGYGPKGEYNEESFNYYEERAKGGFGLIISGELAPDNKVDPYDPDSSPSILDHPNHYIKTGRELTHRVHQHGAKIFAHFTLGLGRNFKGLKAPSAVGVFGDPTTKSQELTVDEIKAKVDCMVQAAVLAKTAGFDGVDVHSFHWGCLLDQFANPFTNKRTDEYGGSLENRVRICKEIIDGIKEACGQDFPVTIRVNLRSIQIGENEGGFLEDEEAGRTLEQSIEICKLLETYGYDAIAIDAGQFESFYYGCPPMYIEKGFTIDMAKALKKHVSVPIIVTGSRLDEPQYMLASVSEDTGDAVGIARASLADPYLPVKLAMGRFDEVKPCIGCNVCMEAGLQGKYMSCAVNPEVLREELVRLTPSTVKKTVEIIGGGLAGMEAARVLTLRGHDVTVFEKSDRLGGNLNAAGSHEFKHDVNRLNKWYQKKMKDLNVRIEMNTAVTSADVLERKPDVILLATGSVPIELEFQGSDNVKVMNALEAIEHEEQIGEKVVIVGGGQVGCEIAIDLASKAKQVTLVEAIDSILSTGGAVTTINKMALHKIIEKKNIHVLTSARFTSFDGENARISRDGREELIEADTVIISVGMKPTQSMANEFLGEGIEVREIGDLCAVGDVHTTIRNAFDIARAI